MYIYIYIYIYRKLYKYFILYTEKEKIGSSINKNNNIIIFSNNNTLHLLNYFYMVY